MYVKDFFKLHGYTRSTMNIAAQSFAWVMHDAELFVMHMQQLLYGLDVANDVAKL